MNCQLIKDIFSYHMIKCSHTTAYDISVCSQARVRRYTFGVPQAYVVYIRRRTLCYTQRPNYFIHVQNYQHMRAYRIYVTHTLTIRTDMLDIRLMSYRYVTTEPSRNPCSSCPEPHVHLTTGPHGRRTQGPHI